jgi:hypothetical protein
VSAGAEVGFVVIEYNQASGQPGLNWAADLYNRRSAAEEAAHHERDLTDMSGRGERYAIARVVLEEDPR